MGVALWIARVPLEGVPHVQDEIVYLAQARALLEGGLGVEIPRPAAAYSYHFLLDRDGLRYGIFPPGWPLVLALGLMSGGALLVNPLLQGATVWVGARLAGRLGGARAAMIAAPLLALSPQLLLQGASQMSHVLCGLLALGALGALVEPLTPRRAALLGALLGGLALTRYLDGLVLGLVVAPALLATSDRRGVALGLGAPLVVAGLLLAAHNQGVTGDALTFPASAYFDAGLPPTADAWWRYAPGCNSLGFGPDRGCFPTYGDVGHDLDKALTSLWTNLRVAGRLWLGLPLALLLLLPALLAAERSVASFARRALVLWGLLALAYALYWVPGLCYGARFHHLAAPAVIVAAALGVERLVVRAPWLRLLPLLLLLPAVWRLSLALPELDGYWGVDGRFARIQGSFPDKDALLLVAYADEPPEALSTPETTGGGLNVRASLRRGAWMAAPGPVRFAEYHPQLISALRAENPGRTLYLYVMAIDPAQDRVTRLPEPSVQQRDDLPLPVSPTLLPLELP